MAKSLTEVEAAALELSETERELLAYRLLGDHYPVDQAIDPAWQAEITRRIHEIESGQAVLLDGDTVVTELHDMLDAKKL